MLRKRRTIRYVMGKLKKNPSPPYGYQNHLEHALKAKSLPTLLLRDDSTDFSVCNTRLTPVPHQTVLTQWNNFFFGFSSETTFI